MQSIQENDSSNIWGINQTLAQLRYCASAGAIATVFDNFNIDVKRCQEKAPYYQTPISD